MLRVGTPAGETERQFGPECGYQIPNCVFVTGGRNLSYQSDKGDIRASF